ncbi:MAG: metalloregulator ArsR/SmtB family transcription factor [Rhodospirillales bacterium]|nr:metalloregulator ArsR/SmtB family transcription factor [Rhodospirillales bacterium]
MDASTIDLRAMGRNARRAAGFLKGLAHEHRLLILCNLADGERSVGELERRLGLRQARLSQQLARLRQDGLVRTRRVSRTIYYRLGSPEAVATIALLYSLFCEQPRAECRPLPAALQRVGGPPGE